MNLILPLSLQVGRNSCNYSRLWLNECRSGRCGRVGGNRLDLIRNVGDSAVILVKWSAMSLLQIVPVTGKLMSMPKLQGSTTQETDEELATSVARRGESVATLEHAKMAFSWLYARHSRLLRAFLSSRISRSDIDDVEQAVWEKIWAKLPEQFQGGNFRAWLYQIARNHLVDSHRRSRPDELSEKFDVSDHRAISPDALVVDQERMQILETCLNKLSDSMSQVVRGRLSGESYEALCERLAIDNARAQKLLFTAKQLLQSCVEGGGK